MTRFLLVRHANKATPPDLLPGRSAGIELSAVGKTQATQLARALGGCDIQRVIASPLLRAQQTARAIATPLGLPVETDEHFNEVEIGDWTNRTIGELAGDQEWHTYNHRRSLALAPRGESMIGVQARVVARLLELARIHPGDTLVVVSHADPIRSALLYFINRSLDNWASIEIDEGSISILMLDTKHAWLAATNLRPEQWVEMDEKVSFADLNYPRGS